MTRSEALADVAALPPTPASYSRYLVLCTTVVPAYVKAIPLVGMLVLLGVVYSFVVFGWAAFPFVGTLFGLAVLAVVALSSGQLSWFDSVADRRSAREFAGLHGGILAMPVWVHAHPDFRTDRVCRGLSPAQREVFDVLVVEWDGTLSEALAAARGLAR